MVQKFFSAYIIIISNSKNQTNHHGGMRMEEIMNVTNQTPIEIALQIDEDGFTTAKKLYEWLELSRNIIQIGARRTSWKTSLQRKMKIIK